jgi:ABC-type spermidine/putrescine transport system permease subunit I
LVVSVVVGLCLAIDLAWTTGVDANINKTGIAKSPVRLLRNSRGDQFTASFPMMVLPLPRRRQDDPRLEDAARARRHFLAHLRRIILPLSLPVDRRLHSIRGGRSLSPAILGKARPNAGRAGRTADPHRHNWPFGAACATVLSDHLGIISSRCASWAAPEVAR